MTTTKIPETPTFNVVGEPVDAALDRLEQASSLIDEAADSLAPAQCDLSVIIPVYNEPKTVLEIVDRVRRLAISKQIIVVNDGSTDETPEALVALERFKEVRVIHHPVNAGKVPRCRPVSAWRLASSSSFKMPTWSTTQATS